MRVASALIAELGGLRRARRGCGVAFNRGFPFSLNLASSRGFEGGLRFKSLCFRSRLFHHQSLGSLDLGIFFRFVLCRSCGNGRVRFRQHKRKRRHL